MLGFCAQETPYEALAFQALAWERRRPLVSTARAAGFGRMTSSPRSVPALALPTAISMKAPEPTMADLDAATFNQRLRALDTPDACRTLFASAIEPFGFDTFASGEVDLTDRDRCAFHLIGWPDSWRDFYFSSGLIERDPIVEALAHRTEPFTWEDLRADRTLSRTGTTALDKVAAAGWTAGFVVPLPQSSGRIGLVSLAGHRPCVNPAERAYLALICMCFHGHVRTLVGRHGFAIAPAGLTAREIDSVRLVARGNSDAQIGRALGIAASTAHEYVEKAKRRLKARSRAELAALAGSFAIVDLGMLPSTGTTRPTPLFGGTRRPGAKVMVDERLRQV